jgi:hypothetical protein
MGIQNGPLAVLLCFALLLTGCQSSSRVTEGNGDSELLHQMAEPAPSQPLTPSLWGDYPGLKMAICVGLVLGALAGVYLVGLATVRADMANQI